MPLTFKTSGQYLWGKLFEGDVGSGIWQNHFT